MHLLKLSIKNFRVIKETSLDLPDKVIGIIGPNGSGKSSIVEAIAWALYGNIASRSAKDEIRATFAGDSATVEVDLEFEMHGEHYRVIRRLVGRTERPEVILYRGGASESVGSTETQRHIARLIGLDWKGFLTSFLARQQELNALSDLAAGKRREHLAGMLGIDRLDSTIQMIKGDSRSSGERAALLNQRLSERDHFVKRVEELSAQLGSLTVTRDQRSGARDTVESRLQKIDQRLKIAESIKEQCSQLTSALAAEQGQQLIIEQQARELGREHEEVLQNEKVIVKLEGSLSGYAETKALYEREHEASQTAKLYDEIKGQVESSKNLVARIGRELAEAETRGHVLDQQLSELPANLQAKHLEQLSAIEKAREDYSRSRSEREVASREVSRLTEQMAGISQLGSDAVCDRCHRPFGNDLNEIRNHLKKELLEADLSLKHHSSDVDRIKSEGANLKSGLEKLDQSVKLQADLTAQASRLKVEIKRLGEESVLAQKNLSDQTERLSKLQQPKTDPARLLQLKEKLEQLEASRRQLDQLTGRVSRKDELVRQLSEATEKLRQSGLRLDELKGNLNQLGFDPKVFEALKKEHNDTKLELETQNSALIQAVKELELTENELKLRTEQLEQFGKVEADLDAARDDHYYGEKLGRLFGDFRKYLIASIRPRLADISTSLFSEMTADRYGQVELDEDYNLRILDGVQLFGIERFSGGEKDLANLCLRLAISIALTESANLDRSFVILDEVFGSQDNNRRELIFKGMANLKQRFPQVFLITHIDEIKNRVEALIEVNSTAGGWSEVRLDGKPTS